MPNQYLVLRCNTDEDDSLNVTLESDLEAGWTFELRGSGDPVFLDDEQAAELAHWIIDQLRTKRGAG